MAGDRTGRKWQAEKSHRRVRRKSHYRGSSTQGRSCVAHRRKPTNLAGGRQTEDNCRVDRSLQAQGTGWRETRTKGVFHARRLRIVSERLDYSPLGDHNIDQVRSVAVEEWLDSVKRAKGTKAKIRNIMSAIFHHAMRYEWVDRNPIKLVRQSAKRERAPEVLELAELQLLLSKLSVRERTLALLDAATGLRVSELLALRW